MASGKTAGVIRINLTAGTTEFLADMDKASAKIKQFKSHGVSDTQATGAAFRALSGQITTNTTAAEGFVSQILKAGPIVQAMFPLVGALAFGGVVSELGTKVHDFFDKWSTGQEKAAAAFRPAAQALHLTNDELALANSRLEQDIAKLEGKPQNGLKIALDEARVAADQLADSLDRDLERVQKVLEEHEITQLFGGFTNQASTSGLIDDQKKFRDRIAQISGEGTLAIRSADDPEKQKAARTALDAQLDVAYWDRIQKLSKQIDLGKRGKAEVSLANGSKVEMETGQDYSGQVEQLNRLRLQTQVERSGIGLSARNTALEQGKAKLTAAGENAKQEHPFENRIEMLGAQLEGLRVKASAIGKGEEFQAWAAGYVDAQKAIVEINKALEKNGESLTELQKARLVDISQTMTAESAEDDWKAKFTSSTQAIEQRIALQQELASAIGKGYAATREVSINSKLIAELGPRASDPKWMAEHSDQVELLRAGHGAETDAEHGTQAKQAVEGLNRQIELERLLAGVQDLGAEAVRRATLAYRIRQLVATGATQKQIQAEMDLYVAQRANASAGNIDQLNQRAAAVKRVADAVMGGAEAERVAALESKYSDMKRAGASESEIGKQRDVDAADRQREVTSEAIKAGRTYRDQLETLGLQVDALNRLKEVYGNTFEIQVAMRDLENRRLDVMVQQTLQLGTARAGVKAFFTEMQKDSYQASRTIYQALTTAFNQGSSELAKLATGQKTNFGGMLQGIGTDMLESQVKKAASKGLGVLGRMTGIDATAALGKPDGSDQGRALWVRMAEIPLLGLSGGKGLNLDGTFGGGAKGKGIYSMLASSFAGFRANGGPVDPGRSYIVGERGPELFTPAGGGSIAPNGSFGGGNVVHNHYHVDARGSDLGAENRVLRGLAMTTHNAAVTNAVRAMDERSARRPK